MITPPHYNNLVKCSYSNELAPLDPNWFYVKAAAVVRKIYITKSKTLGVGSLKSMFNKKHRRGVNCSVTSRHSGKILRDIIGQLKKIGYVENYVSSEGASLGLLVTRLGKAQLDKISASLKK